MIHLRSSRLVLELDPSNGAKISSLRSVRSGREWLWSNPWIEHKPSTVTDPLVRAYRDSGGADECFPSVVGSTTAEGQAVADHGEAWGVPWKILPSPDGTAALFWESADGAWRLERRITALPDTFHGGFRLAWRLENRGPREKSWLWAFHCLLRLEHGMRLDISGETSELRHPAAFDAAGRQVSCPTGRWPMATIDGSDIDLSVIQDPEIKEGSGPAPYALKSLLRCGPGVSVGLSAPGNQERLEIGVPDQPEASLAFWRNCRAWKGIPGASPYFNLGIEPSMGFSDDLAEAVRTDSAVRLEAGGRREWSLRIGLF